MRRWLVISLPVAGLAGLGLYLWPRGETPNAPANVEAVAMPDFEAVDVTSQSQAGGLALTGTVRDPAGHPVSSALVSLAASGQASLTSVKCGDCGHELLSCPARESALKVASLLAAKKGELASALTTTTDAHGAFRFEHLTGVSFSLWATAKGFGEGVKERAAPGDPVELFLPPLRALAGK